MKLFDILGVISVTAWVVLVGAFTYELNSAAEAEDVGRDVVITEGDSWMMLTREQEEVGFVHETRTRLDDGWLLEYEMAMLIEVAGVDQLLETRTRATLDEQAYLRQFNGDIISFMGSFTVKGEVKPTEIALTMNFGGAPRTRTIPLKDPPRLSNSAINQLVADTSRLEPGRRFEQEYFDPMTSGMSKLVFEFIKRDDVEVYGVERAAFHFRQQLMGDEFDVFVSPEGEVLVQEFPMRTIGALVPSELGKTRASALRRKFKKIERERSQQKASGEGGDAPAVSTDAIKPQEVGVTGALKMLGEALIPRAPADEAGADMGADMDADMSEADLGASPDQGEPGEDAPRP